MTLMFSAGACAPAPKFGELAEAAQNKGRGDDSSSEVSLEALEQWRPGCSTRCLHKVSTWSVPILA